MIGGGGRAGKQSREKGQVMEKRRDEPSIITKTTPQIPSLET